MPETGQYPPSHLNHLVRRIESAEASAIKRDWTGNDQSARQHTGVASPNESPLRLRLSWKKGPKEPVTLIGVFDLDLRQLLAESYVRADPSGPDAIRLRFYHGPRGTIYIQANEQGPALPIGEVS